MKFLKLPGLLAVGLTIAACENAAPGDKTRDRGINGHHLSTMVAGIWVDPNGCDHWIIDDGIEGYMSERMTPDGRPVCSGVAPPETVVGPFKAGSTIVDPVRTEKFRRQDHRKPRAYPAAFAFYGLPSAQAMPP